MVSIECNMPTLLAVDIPPQLTMPEEENEHDESLSTRNSPIHKRTESMVSYVLPTANITIDFPESPQDVFLRREIVDLVGVPRVFTGDLGAPEECKIPSASNTHATTADDDEFLSRSVSWTCFGAEGKGSIATTNELELEEENSHDVPEEIIAHQSCDKDRKQWTEKIRGNIDFFRGQLHKIQLKKEHKSRVEVQTSDPASWFRRPQLIKPAGLYAPRLVAPSQLAMGQQLCNNSLRMTSFSAGATTNFVVRTATSMRAVGFQNGIPRTDMPPHVSLSASPYLHSRSSAPPRLVWDSHAQIGKNLSW